jgi:hypothetical protein
MHKKCDIYNSLHTHIYVYTYIYIQNYTYTPNYYSVIFSPVVQAIKPRTLYLQALYHLRHAPCPFVFHIFIFFNVFLLPYISYTGEIYCGNSEYACIVHCLGLPPLSLSLIPLSFI